jgi:hypothetical protein
MQRMREVIRASLARSLRLLAEEDRIAAALPVVCGSVLASHCEVVRLDDEGKLHVSVDSPEWMSPLLGMREVLQHDLQRVAGVPLSGVHFIQAGSAPDRPLQPPFAERAQPAPGRQRPARRSTFNPKGRPA